MSMPRVVMLCLGLAFVTAATAQDFAGQAADALSSANSAAGTAAVNSAMGGHGRQGGDDFRGTGFSEGYVRKQCAGLAQDRAKLGAQHRRVVRWTRVCQQAGLSR